MTREPPSQGTKIRAVLDAFDPGDRLDGKTVLERASEEAELTSTDVYSYLRQLRNRGFVRPQETERGQPTMYTLTNRGEAVASSGASTSTSEAGEADV